VFSFTLGEVHRFVTESNAIEGIHREPTDAEVQATVDFLRLDEVTIPDLCNLVSVYQPGNGLRMQRGNNVRVGRYVAPEGGPHICQKLEELLCIIHPNSPIPSNPWRLHCQYESLHPFTDGNGRSGRALWAWQMVRRPEGLSLGFLHRFYYQTLEHAGR
jgi:hypothetical protein